MPRVENVAVPPVDKTAVVPMSVAPALTVAVTVVSPPTTLIIGWVLKAAPAAAPAALVEKAMLVAARAGCD